MKAILMYMYYIQSIFQELEAIKARVKEMEEEAEKLKQMQKSVDEEMHLTSPTTAAAGDYCYFTILKVNV